MPSNPSEPLAFVTIKLASFETLTTWQMFLTVHYFQSDPALVFGPQDVTVTGLEYGISAAQIQQAIVDAVVAAAPVLVGITVAPQDVISDKLERNQA